MNGHHPWLTTNLPGIGGHIKTTPEDFYVEEIPRYTASGQGQHVYLTLEKRGLTTLKAINMIAGALGVPKRSIGYAGLKDAQATTRQTVSIDGTTPEAVAQLNLPGIKILTVDKHKNKLKLGHLAGNKFVIRVRDVKESDLAQAETILGHLSDHGVPNYFGQQRFGVRNNSHLLGLALIKNNLPEFMAEFLGRPHANENQQAQQARAAFDTGDSALALDLWPPMLREERTVLQMLIKSGSEEKALRVLDRRIKRLFVSACQSNLFNQLLADRLPALNKVVVGDVAYLHRNGACFVVESAEKEQPRADAFEISPAGPLFGEKYLPAAHEPGQKETALLQSAGLSPADFGVPGLGLSGSRRPYRIPLNNFTITWDEGLVLSFSLPPGAYATMVLREIMKND